MSQISQRKVKSGRNVVKTLSLEFFNNFLSEHISDLKNPVIEKYDGERITVDEIASSLLTTNIFSPVKVGIIKFSEKKSQKIVEELSVLLSKPSQGIYIFLLLMGEGFENCIKKLEEKGWTFYDLDALWEREKREIIVSLFKKKGLKIEEKALSFLEETLSTYDFCKNIVEKLWFFKKGQIQFPVTIHDLREIISVPEELDLFNFIDALIRGDKKGIIEGIEVLGMTEDEEVMKKIFFLLQNSLFIIFLLKRGVSPQGLMEAKKIHPYRMKKLRELERNLSEERIKKLMDAISSIDYEGKTYLRSKLNMRDILLKNIIQTF